MNGFSVIAMAITAGAFAVDRSARAQILATPEFVEHYLGRMTFGPTAALRSLANDTPALLAHIDEQLDPFGPGVVEDADLDPLLQQLNLPDTSVGFQLSSVPATPVGLQELRLAVLIRAIKSTRQLNELMTFFWENMFNTDFQQFRFSISQKLPSATDAQLTYAQVYCEKYTNDAYRLHALGTFRDLLDATIRSPSMLMFLNGDGNAGCAKPNENFGRELLELYSLGVKSGLTGLANYSQDDVVAVAKILTGLRVDVAMQPVYDLALHCAGPKTLFVGTPHAVTIADGGEQEIDDLIDHLAGTAAVAEFVCRKLVAFFLADAAAQPGVEDVLIQRMMLAWGTDGDIGAVMTVLIQSAAFTTIRYPQARARIPLERVTSWVRLWGTDMNFAGQLSAGKATLPLLRIDQMGQGLFTFPSPDGFPLASAEQPSSSGSIDTAILGGDPFRWALPPSLPGPWLVYPTPDVLALVTGAGLADPTDATQVATFLLEHAFLDRHTTLDVTIVRDALANDLNGNPVQLDPNLPTAYLTQLLFGVSRIGAMVHAQVKY